MTDPVADAANAIAQELDADVLFYCGEIGQRNWLSIVKLVKARNKRDKLLLVITSPGGDPDASFKIGRFLQEKYSEVYVFVPGWCKSAGTLLTLAGSRIYIGDCGEMGPLDIQLAKADEIMEMGSGLLMDAALKTLEQTASKMFINFLYGIRRDTRGGLTTRTAAEIASHMVSDLLKPVYAQIEPIKIGENSRAMNIMNGYAARLNIKSNSLRDPKSIDFLVSSYPDHGFVIDKGEAKILFRDVQEPTVEMNRLSDALGDVSVAPGNKTEIRYLSDEPKKIEKAAAREELSDASNRRPKPNGRSKRGAGDQPEGSP